MGRTRLTPTGDTRPPQPRTGALRRRAAALALLVPLTPLLISLTPEKPAAEAREPPKPPEGRRAVAEEPRRRRTAEIRSLGVNDLHGYLERTPEGAGAAYLAVHLDRYERPNTIRVHAGDMVSASPLVSAHFHDEPAVLAMGFDVGTERPRVVLAGRAR